MIYPNPIYLKQSVPYLLHCFSKYFMIKLSNIFHIYFLKMVTVKKYKIPRPYAIR